jgi:hypothetical protein
VVVGDFNTHLSPTDRSSKKKSQKEYSRMEWHCRSNGPDRCLQSILSCNSTIYILRCTWNFLQIDHILGHKASLNKHKKTELTPCILSEQTAIKLEFNNKRNSRKYSNN